ncbi:hypothetical protein BDD12DRAFT_743825, partial [Trichophaea hybrida]
LIAIHGLGGGCITTWKHKRTEQTWLHDMLPIDLKGVRVWTYGYEADVAFSSSTTRISDFSNTLLQHAKNKEVGKQVRHSSRRIIWVCHSLGGIVVKKVAII